MRKMASVMVLLVVFVVVLGTQAFAAPNIAGVWKGKVMKSTPTACTNLSATLTVIQCTTGSNLIRGTLALGSTSYPIVGRILANGITIEISGSLNTASALSQLSLTAKYIDSPTDQLQVTFIDISTVSLVTGDTLVQLYDIFTLTKQ
jgi:hypothetical protein